MALARVALLPTPHSLPHGSLSYIALSATLHSRQHCGLGHIAAYCLVAKDTPPPTWMTEAQKKNLLERRKAYKANKTNAATPTPVTMSMRAPTATSEDTRKDESPWYSPFVIF